MTGFFERLAARARGEPQAMRPRLQGLFESAPGQLFDQSEVFAVVETPAPEPPPPVFALAREVGVVSETSDRGEAASAPPPVQPAPPAAAPKPTVPAVPLITVAPPITVAAVVPAPPVASRDQRQPPAPMPARPAPGLTRRDDPLAPAPRLSRRDDPPPAAVRPDPVRVRQDTDPVRAASTPEPAAAPPTLAPSPRPSPAEITPRVVRARPQQTPPPTVPRQEETTVHVSIGRIEVRAIQPPLEARPRELAKSAVMSLDEYLRSRRERR